MNVVKKLMMCAIGMLGLTTAAYAQDANNPPRDLAQLVQNVVKPIMAQNNIPGVAVAVYYQGQPYFFNFGVADTSKQAPVTSTTIFDLGSVSKAFTADLIAIEVQQGQVKLDNFIPSYLPPLAGGSGAPVTQITVKELATHTSSLPRTPYDIPGMQGVPPRNLNGPILYQSLLNWQPDYPIGTKYAYSNIGFGLLGVIAGNAVNSTFMDALRQDILQPLNMQDTFVDVPAEDNSRYAQGYGPDGNPVPRFVLTNALPGAGALRSTPTDMMAFLEANLGIASGGATPQMLHAFQFAQQGFFQVNPNFMQGLAWQRMNVHGTLLINKNGMDNGFNSYIGMLPKQQIGVVVLVNKRVEVSGRIANEILFRLINQEPPQMPQQNAA